MGESACLMQPFSQASSDTSHETREVNPMHALAESVSFGRFLSESLAWEKWSSFSHNRHLEDVEKYSKPGSVAQKKAYFEAHYKKIAAQKAAALIEQENEAASNIPQQETQDGAHNNAALVSHLAECNGHVAVDEALQAIAPSMEVTDPVMEKQVLEKNPLVVEPLNQIADVGNHGMLTEVESSGTNHMDQTHSELELFQENIATSQETLTSATKEKPLVSSSKPSAYNRESMLSSSPVESITSIRSRKENIATPNYRKSARDPVQKKCSTPKSLHMSINFASNQETLGSATNTRAAVSSSKPSAYGRVSGLQSPTARSTTTVHSRKENNPTPNSTKSARDSGNKKCSIPKSLHMSINFAANQETLASATKTKPEVSSSKPSLYSRASKLPSYSAKSTTLVHSRKETNATPNNKKSAGHLVNKKCSTPKSLHMSINFAANQETLASATKSKPEVSSSKPSLYSRASKIPSSSTKSTIVHSSKETNATPNNKKSAVDFVNKKCSTPKSLHMSINITPSGAGEINKNSSVWQKIADSRGSESLSTFKHCPTPLRTPTTVSVNGLPKNPSVTPQSERRSTRTKLDLPAFGSSKEGAERQSISVDRSKSSGACGGITRSPIISSPFSFRTDERATKRKEKLENKYNAEEAQNLQLQMKSKEKAESELKKLHQSLGFKAKPMPDFYRETESGKNQINKISLTQPRSSKLRSKLISNAAQDPSSLPPRRPTVKNDYSKSVTEKNNRIPTHSITTLLNKGIHPQISSTE